MRLMDEEGVGAGLEAGTEVRVRHHLESPGGGLAYPTFPGTLLEYCNGMGWDAVNVRDTNGDERSVYSFSVERAE